MSIEVRTMFLAVSVAVLSSCASAGTPDAGPVGGGAPDSGTIGGGTSDGGTSDGGTSDGGGSPGPTDAGLTGDAALLGRPCMADADCGGLMCRLDPQRNRGHQVCTIPCSDSDPASLCADRFGTNAVCAGKRNPDGSLASSGFCAWSCARAACATGTECVAEGYCDRIDRKKCSGEPTACSARASCYGFGCTRCGIACSEITPSLGFCVDPFASTPPECVVSGGTCNDGLFPGFSCRTQPDQASCVQAQCVWKPTCVEANNSGGYRTCTGVSDDATCMSQSCTITPCRGTPTACEALDTADCAGNSGCAVP